jgi:hypothetical protein
MQIDADRVKILVGGLPGRMAIFILKIFSGFGAGRMLRRGAY